MPSKGYAWVRKPLKPSEAEKHAIIAACEALIRDVLIPRFLPAIRETSFNYPVGLHGDWRAGRYRFLQRYRSGFPDNRGEEFDSPFARLDYVAPDLFHIQWMRHTGQWWQLHSDVTLARALDLLQTDGHLHPF